MNKDSDKFSTRFSVYSKNLINQAMNKACTQIHNL